MHVEELFRVHSVSDKLSEEHMEDLSRAYGLLLDISGSKLQSAPADVPEKVKSKIMLYHAQLEY